MNINHFYFQYLKNILQVLLRWIDITYNLYPFIKYFDAL